jgi:succinate-semialdehyde dehydrogenase/glutarate-semialdehyde dehydrogenase
MDPTKTSAPAGVAAELPAERLEVHNPATGQRAGSVRLSSAADVAPAAANAREAQRRWAAARFADRARIVRRFHDAILGAEHERVLDVIQSESGKSRRDALVEVLTVAGTASYYLAHGRRFLAAERRRSPLPGFTRVEVLRRPHGLVGIISPWNYPFLLGIADALPALLAGNAVLAKPSELTPLSAEIAREILIAAGLDPDLLILLHGPGATLGPALIDQVDYVGFTGSTASGRQVALGAARRLIPYSLELGGKNPMIVTADADVDDVVTGIVAGSFSNSGQTCISIERIYVERPALEPLKQALKARLADFRLGFTASFETDMGSLIGEHHARKVEDQVEAAKAAGARVVCGGRRRTDLGAAFFEPTVLEDVPPTTPLAREETFGPVVALYPFDRVDEAIAAANDSDYGLNASVWSGRRGRSRRIARSLETGSVGVNATLLVYHSFDAPMGGMKQSGLGRRHGAAGIQRYTEAQTIVESTTALGGYESLWERSSSNGFARFLKATFRWRRHVPGAR